MSGIKTVLPDYNNCTANLICTILRYFEAEAPESSDLELLKSALQREYRNVIVLLLDGMGTKVLEKNLSQDGFFRSHLAGSYSTVFPSTTVAATTTMDNGLHPCSHGWLGWTNYFKELDKNVELFSNLDENNEPAAAFHAGWKYCAYRSVANRLLETDVAYYEVSRFCDEPVSSFGELCDRIRKLAARTQRKYIYAYWEQPDNIIHRTGVSSVSTAAVLEDLEKQTEALAGELGEDTLLIVTADHGLIDTKNVSLEDYPKINGLLERAPSIEPRALNLFVKKGCEQEFKRLFNEAFQDKFELYTREEIKRKQLFGTGTPHPRLDELLGDFVAVAVSDLTIFNDRESAESFVGVHAGLTEDEMMVPLIIKQ